MVMSWVEKVVLFSGKKNFVIYTFFLALSPSPSEFQWEFSSHFCVCDFFASSSSHTLILGIPPILNT